MKINHILFPVDFSGSSAAMNPEVEWLASHFDSRVTLLHVFELPTSWYGTGDAPLMTAWDLSALAALEKQRLQDYAIDLPESRITRVSEEGSAAWHIARFAEENGVDLMVLGTHGYGPVRRFLLGSVAMKVLHDVNCPVWTHPAPTERKSDTKRGISNVLCSIELSAEAVPLLRATREFAASLGAKVQLVHCVPETESRPGKYFDSELHQSLKDCARAELTKLQQAAATEFPVHITEHSISHDIAELAVSQHADLVVIGRGKAHDRFGTLRTRAYEIIRHAPCPVLSFSMAAGQSEASAPARKEEKEVEVPSVS